MWHGDKSSVSSVSMVDIAGNIMTVDCPTTMLSYMDAG